MVLSAAHALKCLPIAICSGSTLVPGTISGPVFTNGAWTFGTSGQYIFTDSVGSVSANSGFQFSDKCDQV
ncbi:MAG: hypothetical protein DMG93_15820, partial [Acidobacteria bacterium]